jgi:rhodanese-related sulfurtransferase
MDIMCVMYRARNRLPVARKAGFVGRLAGRMLALVGLSFGAGAISHFSNHSAPDWGDGTVLEGEMAIEDIPADANVVWVDARERDQFEKVRVKGAILVNETEYYSRVGYFLAKCERDDLVLVYCAAKSCDSSRVIARRLREEIGAESVYVVHGGWDAIVKSGIELEVIGGAK